MTTATSREGLVVRGLCRRFGALQVTSNVDLTLRPGARAALIGPNGAGKTTLVNLITGALAPSAGTVHLDGRDITQLDPAARARLGLLRSFQITRLFRTQTVADNVRQAVLQRGDRRLGLWRPVRGVPGLDEEVDRALRLLQLHDRAQRRVADLAYGEQRLVELALAVAARPRVLLLDEPAAGVPQGESHVIVQAIEALPADLAVLLIEHDMDLVFRLARDITVLVAGAVLMQGSPDQVAHDARVRSLYLGEHLDETLA
jgi:branched-chain amino acid transport system ATP-binding protein